MGNRSSSSAVEVASANRQVVPITRGRRFATIVTQFRIAEVLVIAAEVALLEAAIGTEIRRMRERVALLKRELRQKREAIKRDLEHGAEVEEGPHVAYLAKRYRMSLRGLLPKRIAFVELVTR